MSEGKSDVQRSSRIYVAGHRGMVGSAILRRLVACGYTNLITRSRSELDLLDQGAVRAFLDETRPDYVFLAAALVGGIQANNSRRADFIYQNLTIQGNVIEAAYRAGVRRLMFLASSCIYPRDCPQPIREEYLLTGPLEPTNEPYAIAKIAGIKLCEAFNAQFRTSYVSVMPTNLYGPGDNYDLESSHVLPALIRKAHEARMDGRRELPVWGTGTPRREFLYVDDLADACVYLMEGGYAGPLLNIGTGKDATIAEVARIVMNCVGLEAELVLDPSKPDGTPRKLLDVSRVNALGWTAKTSLAEGISKAYADFLATRG